MCLIFLWVRVGRWYQFIAGQLGCRMLFMLLSENRSDVVLSMAGTCLQNKTRVTLARPAVAFLRFVLKA